MSGNSTISIYNNLSSGKTYISGRTTNYESSCRIDMYLYIR